MIARLTLKQIAKAYTAVKKAPKAKQLAIALPKMPKKKGWKKPLFPKSKMFPQYSKYDLAIDTGILAASYGTYKYVKKQKLKKNDPKYKALKKKGYV